jgi:hypothetical protein
LNSLSFHLILLSKKQWKNSIPHYSFWLLSKFLCLNLLLESSCQLETNHEFIPYTTGIFTSGHQSPVLCEIMISNSVSTIFSSFLSYEEKQESKDFPLYLCNSSCKSVHWYWKSLLLLDDKPFLLHEVKYEISSQLFEKKNYIGTTSKSLKIQFWFVKGCVCTPNLVDWLIPDFRY